MRIEHSYEKPNCFDLFVHGIYNETTTLTLQELFELERVVHECCMQQMANVINYCIKQYEAKPDDRVDI